MRRAAEVVWRSVDQAVVVGRPGRDALIIRGPAADVWDLLAGDLDPDDLVSVLAVRYGAPIGRVHADVQPVLERLVAEGFVVR